ncbi:urease accessory protein UreE [Roseibium aquae]|uniref:Urease accessory protein UreE n=1 Tax=Roseibium aquae TaxID=1323746 RepID=A0A916TCR8_9HYPH|nr:urease accessory protein UreE [Roseibium aquae]GGB39979.1 urease accessory protein UreE [Roseibium aquae]
MNRVTEILPAGTWSGPASDTVQLDREARHKRRAVLTGQGGLIALLDEPKAVFLADGDALRLDSGQIMVVRAAPEDLVEIEADDMAHLVKIAWHLGNRHLPTQLFADRLRIRRDHVIEDMVRKLGGRVTQVTAAFDPEGGAYGYGQTRGHGHSHGHHHD